MLEPKKGAARRGSIGDEIFQFEELSLVEYEDLSFQIIRKRFVDKTYEYIGFELALLCLRFEAVLNQELELEDLPISPQKLSDSFQYAIKPIELNASEKEVFFELLLTAFRQCYQKCLHQANNTFIDKGILTTLNESDGSAYFKRKQRVAKAETRRKSLIASISENEVLDADGRVSAPKMDELLEQIVIPDVAYDHVLHPQPIAPDASRQELLASINELQNIRIRQ